MLTTAEIVSIIVAIIMQSGTALKVIEDLRAQGKNSVPAEIMAKLQAEAPHVHAAIVAHLTGAQPGLPDPYGGA